MHTTTMVPLPPTVAVKEVQLQAMWSNISNNVKTTPKILDYHVLMDSDLFSCTVCLYFWYEYGSASLSSVVYRSGWSISGLLDL